MSKEQLALLLTVARILRARVSDTRANSNDDDDLFALDDALKPFAPKQGVTNAEGVAGTMRTGPMPPLEREEFGSSR